MYHRLEAVARGRSGAWIPGPTAARTWEAARPYLLGTGLWLGAHLVMRGAWPVLGPAISTVYLAAVVISALYAGRGPALLTTALAVVDLGYTFLPPYRASAVDFDNFLFLCAFLSVALLTSSLQARRQRAEESLRAAHRELERRVRERTEALARSQEQFSLLVNGVADHAFFTLDEHGRIASWNAGARRLIGYEGEEVTGGHLERVWPGARAAGFPAGTGSGGSVPDDACEHQDWIVRRDGSRFWARIMLTRLQDDEGRHRGHAIAVRDVTERRSLEREILEISERERERIGNDLHDGLGQELAGVALLSATLAESIAAEGKGYAERAEHVADLLHDAIRHARELAHGLSPVDLEDEGLPSALRQLTDRLAHVPQLRCTCEVPRSLRVERDVASHLYRIAQEAIHNAVRHGKAHTIDLRLVEERGRLTLTVDDDGIGFPSHGPVTGMGVRLMNYRAKAIRGSLEIVGRSPCGTTVRCTVGGEREAR